MKKIETKIPGNQKALAYALDCIVEDIKETECNIANLQHQIRQAEYMLGIYRLRQNTIRELMEEDSI